MEDPTDRHSTIDEQLLTLATEISAIIAGLQDCQNHFKQGKNDQAINNISQVEERIDKIMNQLQDTQESNNQQLYHKLDQAKQNISWIIEKESTSTSPG